MQGSNPGASRGEGQEWLRRRRADFLAVGSSISRGRLYKRVLADRGWGRKETDRLRAMKVPALFRRRQLWVPTALGWLLLLLACGVALVVAGRRVSFFLSPSQPVGAEARLLVVEGWMPALELDDAVAAFRGGGYERVVTTGGPIEEFDGASTQTYAERARSYLVRQGLPSERVIAVPAPRSAQDRSFITAVMVRDWVAQSGLAVDALDVFSSGVHARRSWRLYRMAFGPAVRIGILSARPSHYELGSWWRTSLGARDVITESVAWLWTELFFHPAPRGSHDEMWGPPIPAREALGERR